MEEAYFQRVKKIVDFSNLTGQRCPERGSLDSSDEKVQKRSNSLNGQFFFFFFGGGGRARR